MWACVWLWGLTCDCGAQFLPQVDKVAVMSEGRLQHFGTYEELVAAGVPFRSLHGEDDEEHKGAGG